MRRITMLGLAVLLALGGSSACAKEDVNCDREDLVNRESECGYYDGSTWILFPWIVPGIGGKPPQGQKPKPPAGVKPKPKDPAVKQPPRQPAKPAPARPVKPR